MNKKEFVEWLKGSALRMIRAMAQSAIASMGTSSMTVGFQWEIVSAQRAWRDWCHC